MANPRPATNYCEKYGFDADWRRERLALLGLTATDLPLAERLRNEILLPNAPAIVEAFCQRLLHNPEAKRVLANSTLDRLKAIQSRYLAGFGADFLGQAYFEERLRTGVLHAWVGVPLGLYICAFQILQALMVEHIQACEPPHPDNLLFCQLVSKLGTLDVSLASEIYHIAQIRDMETSVAQLEREWTELHQAATTDALTTLANRADIMPKLAHLLADAVRGDNPLCVIMSDLDHFKRINDSHGHQVGDQVLRDTAARLRAALRDFDLVARYGGEEFIAVLRDTPLATAQQVAERVRRRIGDSPFNIAGTSLVVTLSQGIAQAHSGDSVDSLVDRADNALYQAKQAGRNCVRVNDGPGRD